MKKMIFVLVMALSFCSLTLELYAASVKKKVGHAADSKLLIQSDVSRLEELENRVAILERALLAIIGASQSDVEQEEGVKREEKVEKEEEMDKDVQRSMYT